MREYVPNELIVDKACDLWAQLLANPKFDALGETGHQDDPNGSMFLAQGLAAMNAKDNPASAESLAKFKESLKRLLMNKTRMDHKTYEIFVADDGYYQTSMHVDYNPEGILVQAGKEAGIPESRWPWKTHLFLSGQSLSLSYGYAAEPVYYYPMDGKWLVTKLSGSDIEKVIEYVRGGKPTFRIES